MTLFELISKLQLAAIRRIPFSIQTAYILELMQFVDFPKHLSSTYDEIFIKKVYQPLVPLSVGSVVVDLGAHLGLFTIFINKNVHDSTIYSFEANPKLFPYLEKNLSRMINNGNSVRAFNIAIASEAGVFDFVMDHENIASLASTAFRDTSQYPDAKNYRSIKVPFDRLDRFILSKIDYLKCDIEGAEYVVFDNSLLSPNRLGQAVIEFHDAFKRSDEICEIIKTALESDFLIYIPAFGEVKSLQQVKEILRFGRHPAVVIKMCSRELLARARNASLGADYAS